MDRTGSNPRIPRLRTSTGSCCCLPGRRRDTVPLPRMPPRSRCWKPSTDPGSRQDSPAELASLRVALGSRRSCWSSSLLLVSWGIALSSGVFRGSFSLGSNVAQVKSSSSISRWPAGGQLYRHTMQDEAASLLSTTKKNVDVALLGLYQPSSSGAGEAAGAGAGRIAVWTDSSCVDNKEDDLSCRWLKTFLAPPPPPPPPLRLAHDLT